MSLLTDILGATLGKKKSGGDTMPEQIMLPGFQQDAGKAISEFIKKYMGQYEPGKDYTGEFVAPMTGSENTGINRLNQFLAAPELSGLFGAAEQNLTDTLGGRFANPNESPFIKSMINLSNMNLQDSIDASRRGAGSRGAYFTRSAQQDENKLRERANLGLDAVVGDFINQERGRQMQASPLAMAFEKYKTLDVPLAKIDAYQTYGSLPRLLQQANLESEYEDFKRKQGELSGVPGTAQNLFSTNTPYVPSYTTPVVQSNNTFGNIMDIIAANEDKVLQLVGGAGPKGQTGTTQSGQSGGGIQSLMAILAKLGGA